MVHHASQSATATGIDLSKPSLTSYGTTEISAGIYVLSGVAQPLLMTVIRDLGLADESCQLYMFFYALGQMVVWPPLLVGWGEDNNGSSQQWPPRRLLIITSCVAVFDMLVGIINFTGAALAGPTIFSIVYSSVTVWTALFSRLILGRSLVVEQWLGVFIVFGGLMITAFDSVHVGPSVAHGLIMVMIGSVLHAINYVMSEAVMSNPTTDSTSSSWLSFFLLDNSTNNNNHKQRLTVHQNCAVQALPCFVVMLLWQIVYTGPRFDDLIWKPMQNAGTTMNHGLQILLWFALASLIHAYSYFFTLCHCPGGATSAGVMKGLQAVLVFVATDWFYCGHRGGPEMCFSQTKFFSLITVVGGVILFGIATEKQLKMQEKIRKYQSYTPIDDMDLEVIKS